MELCDIFVRKLKRGQVVAFACIRERLCMCTCTCGMHAMSVFVCVCACTCTCGMYAMSAFVCAHARDMLLLGVTYNLDDKRS